MTSPVRAPPGFTDSPCAARKPDASPGMVVGMSVEMTFTTPPSALLPYMSDAGPRTTSMRLAASGSMESAWSAEVLDRSPVRWPFCTTSTRSPERPRMTGVDAAGPP